MTYITREKNGKIVFSSIERAVNWFNKSGRQIPKKRFCPQTDELKREILFDEVFQQENVIGKIVLKN